MKSIVIRATIGWFGLLVLAFVNGALREVGYKPFIGEPWAHHLSIVIGIALFTVFTWFIWPRLKIKRTRDAWLIAVYWLFLTAIAETFLIGRLLVKESWDRILQNYNVAQGELWPVVLLWILVMPRSVMWLKR